MAIKRINLISGPRNISTALMYSFDNREDTSAVDEPMYAYYLHKSGAVHPAKKQILEALPTSLECVIKDYFFPPIKKPYYFIKGMAQHYYKTDLDFILDLENVFLIRDPRQLIASFSKVIENPSMRDIGLKKEYEIFSFLCYHDKNPVVLDSGELLKNPGKVLGLLCEHIEIPFSEEMLEWSAGPRKVDGVWAPFWYKSVHKSTGFIKPRKEVPAIPATLTNLLNESERYYSKLFKHAIKA